MGSHEENQENMQGLERDRVTVILSGNGWVPVLNQQRWDATIGRITFVITATSRPRPLSDGFLKKKIASTVEKPLNFAARLFNVYLRGSPVWPTQEQKL